MVSGSVLGLSRQLASLRRLSSLSRSALLQPEPELPDISLSRTDPPLGKFIVLSQSSADQRVSVYAGPGANQIYSSVFTAVLNSSFIVDYETVSHGLDSYYFTKPEVWRYSDDIAQLRRLGSKINLTVHESQSDSSKTMDVKLHLENTIINIR